MKRDYFIRVEGFFLALPTPQSLHFLSSAYPVIQVLSILQLKVLFNWFFNSHSFGQSKDDKVTTKFFEEGESEAYIDLVLQLILAKLGISRPLQRLKSGFHFVSLGSLNFVFHLRSQMPWMQLEGDSLYISQANFILAYQFHPDGASLNRRPLGVFAGHDEDVCHFVLANSHIISAGG